MTVRDVDLLAERPAEYPPVSWWMRGVLVVLGFTSVASLLGWVYGVGSFDTLMLVITIPGAVALVAIAGWSVWVDHRGLRDMLAVGAIAGLVGTLGYDLFRVPFVFGGGFLVLSPIESYGVLASGSDSSSAWTDFVGWTYHVSNGIGFGIAYAALAWRRHWAWGIAFALALETGTVLTPFADAYQLDGKWFIIGLAYAAHVPYGLALGFFCQRPERTRAHLAILGRHAVPVAIAGTIIGLGVWLRPTWPSSESTAGDQPAMVVTGSRIEPEFVVLAPGTCAIVQNESDEHRVVTLQSVEVSVPAGDVAELCPTSDGVHHVKSDAGSFRGGFLIVDPMR